MAKSRSLFRRTFWILLWLGLGAGLAYLFWLPDVPWLKNHNPKKTSLMELREAQARETKRPLRSKMSWRPLGEISPYLVHAVLVAEDDRFYEHSGFDLEQIRIAVRRDWDKKRFVYGGSTL